MPAFFPQEAGEVPYEATDETDGTVQALVS